MAEDLKKPNCPNCLGPAIKEGNTIICEKCDAIFTFTKTGYAKVKEIGRMESIESRIRHIESILVGPEPESKNIDEPEESSILG